MPGLAEPSRASVTANDSSGLSWVLKGNTQHRRSSTKQTRLRALEFYGIAEANPPAADRAPEVGIEAVALEVKQTLCSVVSPSQLEEERREVERLCLRDRGESSAGVGHAAAGLPSRRLLGRYQRREALIDRCDGRRAGDRLRRGAECWNPRAPKRD